MRRLRVGLASRAYEDDILRTGTTIQLNSHTLNGIERRTPYTPVA